MIKFLLRVLALGTLTIPLTAGAVDPAWVMTTDFSAFGRVRSFDTSGPWTVSDDLATIPGDAVGRWHEGLVYVVGRGSANLIQVYDPQAGLGLVREFSLGANLNLQDIAFDSQGEAYVSCYDQAVLLRIDVASETILQTFSTAAFADADGLPETGWMHAVGDRLYVTCQKLDRNNWYAPTGPGALLVLDMAAEAWVDTDPLQSGIQPIALVGPNPYTRLETRDNGAGGIILRVGCAGLFGLADGGLEEVDLTAGISLGYLMTEAQVGGDILTFVNTGDDLHLLVSDANFITSLRRWNRDSATVSVLDTGNGYVHADLAWDGDFQLFLADRTLNDSGIRVFDTGSGSELTVGPLATGLPPAMFIGPAGGPVASIRPPGPNSLSIGSPFPNPCNPTAETTISGVAGAQVEVGVFDLRGRRIRGRSLVLDGGGRAIYRFDGRDDAGRNLPAGVYRLVVQGDAALAATSLTLLK